MPHLSLTLLNTLRRGAHQLSPQALLSVRAYVESQRTKSEAFIDRNAKPDLYYTLFGWALCHAIDIPTNSHQRAVFLDSHHPTRLDPLHLTVLTLCRQLHRLLDMPRIVPLRLLALVADDTPLLNFFNAYQQHGSGEGTNAWAARLAAPAAPAPSAFAVGKAPTATVTDGFAVGKALLAMQHPTGGFLAHRSAPMPDMLSTAVALFALTNNGIKPRYDARPFIEAHWLNDGSFAATLLDDHGDTEYQFYGLLALGCLDT